MLTLMITQSICTTQACVAFIDSQPHCLTISAGYRQPAWRWQSLRFRSQAVQAKINLRIPFSEVRFWNEGLNYEYKWL